MKRICIKKVQCPFESLIYVMSTVKIITETIAVKVSVNPGYCDKYKHASTNNYR